MCGICGVFNFDLDRRVPRDTLEAMNDAILHRGPDDEGFFLSENVGLAMRRLSIVDLKTGHQPVSNEDNSIWLVYNGETYNHQELRAQLEARGHRYRSRTDTETIVHLYEEYGRDCVKFLKGMFAFVLWDSRKRVLFGARDRFGIKPLYYRLLHDAFHFGSEIKCLLRAAQSGPSQSAPKFNLARLPEYLAFGFCADGQTFYQDIRKLPPGHSFEIDERGQLKTDRYYQLPQPGSSQPLKFEDCVHRYEELLKNAVTTHLMSDVPLGVFLSGGLDSSAVAAFTREARSEPLAAFSVGYEETPYSELNYAAAVARHLGMEFHEVRVDEESFFNALPKLIWHEDEPLVWPSSVSLYFVAELAREHVKVVLTGEGSDETLAGYTRYAFTLKNLHWAQRYRSLAPGRLQSWLRSLASSGFLGRDIRRKLEHTFLARDPERESFYFDNFYSAFDANQQRELLHADVISTAESAYATRMELWNNASGDLMQKMLRTDIASYLVELCMKQDQMSMAASIESRVPFLDHEVVEFALAIPAEYQIRGLAGKQVLKQIMRGRLPDSILFRRKMGFPTPWPAWLTGARLDSIEQTFLEPRSLDRKLFRREAVQNLFAEHRSKRRDHADRIWRLLNLELWLRVFIEGSGLEAACEPERLTASQA